MEVTIVDGIYDFPDIKQGNRFKARQITFTDTNGDPPEGQLIEVHLRFRFEKKTGTIQKYIFQGSGITIDDAENWIITIDKFTVDFPIGKYFYDVDVVNDSEDQDTPLAGTQKVKINV